MDDFDDFDDLDDMQTMQHGQEKILAYVDRYELTSELGRGGFGMVYLAVDTVSDQQVALKTLPPELSHRPEELEHVRANFKLVSNLHHQNIAAMKHLHPVQKSSPGNQSVPISAGEYLMVMEYIQGSTLSSWKKQFTDRKVPFQLAVEICTQIASALDYAHENKIIHRDIKPGNIMIDINNKVKVLDFGLAAEIRSSMSDSTNDGISGTLPYMSPEQLNGGVQDHRADQYALAVVFYQMITGKVPFQSVFETKDTLLITKIVSENEIDSVEILSKQQNTALLKALSKDMEQRHTSCLDFMESFSKTEQVGSFNKKAVIIACASIVLLLCAFFVFIQETPKKTATITVVDVPAVQVVNKPVEVVKFTAPVQAEQVVVPTPKEKPPEVLAKPSLDIRSNVPSMIFRAGEYLGTTPIVLNLDKDESYFFLVKADGYESSSFNLLANYTGKRSKNILLVKTKAVKYHPVTNARYSSMYKLAEGSSAAQERQKNYVTSQKKPLEIGLNKTRIRLRLIPQGSFSMGTNEHKQDEQPLHKALLSQGFYMGKFEVTKEEWRMVMGSSTNSSLTDSSNEEGDLPVSQVSWKDCELFLRRLEEIEGLPPGSLRLPTETEWEYACKAGSQTSFYTGSKLSTAQSASWCYANSGKNTANDSSWSKKAAKDMKCKPQVVGQKKANAFGLHDMHGNVWEWCQDWYGAYSKNTKTDFLGPASGSFRVLRGGSCLLPTIQSRSTIRSWYPSNYRTKDLGFRIVMNIK